MFVTTIVFLCHVHVQTYIPFLSYLCFLQTDESSDSSISICVQVNGSSHAVTYPGQASRRPKGGESSSVVGGTGAILETVSSLWVAEGCFGQQCCVIWGKLFAAQERKHIFVGIGKDDVVQYLLLIMNQE